MAKIFKTSLILLFIILCPIGAHAASLSISPASGSYAIGNQISATVNVSSTDQPMNAASGIISFPTDKLQVTSLTKDSSIFNFWVQDPTFSNTAGTINFEGVVLSPGFTGAKGKMVTVNFKVKAPGVASVGFSSGSVLANDGNGTNILTDMGSAKFVLDGAILPIVPVVPIVPVTPAPVVAPVIISSNTPSSPTISSDTHPDQTKWYSSNNPNFSWSLPSDVTGARLLFNRYPLSVATTTYKPAVSSKQLFNLKEGDWYFHVALANSSGWGKTANFKFNIDTEAPTRFNITEVSSNNPQNSQAIFNFISEDKTSGIDHYEIQIDGSASQTWIDDGSHKYETPILPPGTHNMIARVVDMAGNYLESKIDFSTNGFEAPKITVYPDKLLSGDVLIVKGTGYPNSHLIVWLQKDNEEAVGFSTDSDSTGNFSLTASNTKLTGGSYKIWAEIVSTAFTNNLPSEKLPLTITVPETLWDMFMKIISPIISFIKMILPYVALVIVLGEGFLFFWRRRKEKREKI